jgi:hypothetical protein
MNLFTYFFLFYDLLVEMKKVKREKMERKLMKEQKQTKNPKLVIRKVT